ncbi:MAG: L-fucose/L-arabinose isomerase family protein [Clostridia bacterium]|nr:L-fucose/L-arabinose isomerase family protein [Clostridia bacterium]
MARIKLAYCPTRRDVFSREEAMKFNEEIRRQMDKFPVDIVDLEGINEEKLLYRDEDIPAVIDRFMAEKVDAIFVPHCNFGSENRVAQVAKALRVPLLLWGPRDDFPDKDGLRSRDSQCGMFATGKVLRRHNIPFTYLTNSWIGSEEFFSGMEKFIRTVSVVKAIKNLNILQISTRPEPFCSVICNENELIEKFGVHLYPITLNDLVVKMKKVQEENSDDLQNTVRRIKEIGTDESEDKILKVASLKVAMKELAKQYHCRAVAIQCWTSLQDIADIMPCCANALLTDEGVPVVCETDIHGAISAIMMQAATMEESTPFFADVTVRHPENDNAELLWHCGNFPYSLVKDKKNAKIGNSRYHNNTYGICEWELKPGELTIARFDGDHGKYSLLIGEAHTTDGPKNVGSYVWIEVDNWAKWEHKIVEGPYIHHVSGAYGKYAEILFEACKYIPELEPDPLLPREEIEARWR